MSGALVVRDYNAMKVIQLESALFGIQTPYNRAVINACRMIPGMRWSASDSAWVGTQDAVDTVCAHLANAGVHVAPLEQPPYQIGQPPLGRPSPRLRPYQVKGAWHLIGERRALLADDMGLGKTLTALSAAHMLGGRLLIVCPARARDVWRRELEVSFPASGRIAEFASSRTPREVVADTIVCHYDILAAWALVLRAWDPNVVIFDEAQNLMNERAARTAAARKIAIEAEYVWGLTGTPIPNRISDLHSIVETIRPGTFGTKFFSFGFRYCAGRQEEHPSRTVPGAKEKHWTFDGASNQDELKQRLGYFMLRRTKSQVALELPPMTRQSIFLDIAAVPFDPGAVANRADTRRLLDLSANLKLKQVISAVIDAAADGTKCVVFTYRQAVAETIAAALTAEGIRARHFHGGVPQARRTEMLRAGHAGELDVLVATIDSAGDAIDLSWASTCVFAELSYEPFKLLQAEARLHRFGQRSNVLIQYYLARGTIDELVARNVIDKLDTMAEVGLTADGAQLQPALQEDADAALFRLYAAIASDPYAGDAGAPEAAQECP